jgi:hypothetical protein
MNNNNSSESTISTPNSSQTTLFSLADFDKKKIEVSFTSAKTSSDGGLMLLREVDKQIDLIGKLAACVKDDRHQGYVQHSIDSMLRQRIMQVAAGYEDANDCDALKDDEIIKLCANGTKLSLPSRLCVDLKIISEVLNFLVLQKCLLIISLNHIKILLSLLFLTLTIQMLLPMDSSRVFVITVITMTIAFYLYIFMKVCLGGWLRLF